MRSTLICTRLILSSTLEDNAVVTEGHLVYNQILVYDGERVPEGTDVINVPERVYVTMASKYIHMLS